MIGKIVHEMLVAPDWNEKATRFFTDWYSTPLEKYNPNVYSYLAVGASDVAAIGSWPRDGYIKKLTNFLSNKIARDVQSYAIAKIGGTVVDLADLAHRRLIPDKHHFNLATVFIGYNDILYEVPEEEYITHTRSLLSLLKKHCDHVCVLNLRRGASAMRIRFVPHLDMLAFERKLRRHSDIIERLAQEIGVTVVNMRALYPDCDPKNDFLSWVDGFHPNFVAHELIAHILMDQIEEIIISDEG